MKIVLIYDKLLRPDTTGAYCESALRTLGAEVIHYAPIRRDGTTLAFRYWEDLPSADLYLQIDDDLAYAAPNFTAPSAYWCIDVHRMDTMFGGSLTRWEKIRCFERVFSAQRDMAQTLGAPWLPLAYDPSVIYPIQCEKVYDWCFIGNFVTQDRIETVERLRARFPNAFIGQAYGEEMNRIYNQSRLAINVSVGNDVNMRFFEVQGSGTPLLSSRPNNGEDELFDAVQYFELPRELPERVAGLLERSGDRTAIAQRQLNCVQRHHTYHARMEQLLSLCKCAI